MQVSLAVQRSFLRVFLGSFGHQELIAKSFEDGAYMALTDAVQDEISAILDKEETLLSLVRRLSNNGKSPTEIAELQRTPTSGWVYQYLRILKALEFGDIPSKASVARQCLSAARSFRKRNRSILTEQAILYLLNLEDRLSAVVVLESSTGPEDEDPLAPSLLGTKGIYVYTLPHYLHNPVRPSEDDLISDKTLMKVGKSDQDVIKRFRQQERITALPEDPLLLRIYSTAGSADNAEKTFHDLLSAADHRRQRGRSAGTEWFLTSLKFLDALAVQLGLSVLYAHEE